MMYTKEKVVDNLAEVKLKQVLEEMQQELKTTKNSKRATLLVSYSYDVEDALINRNFIVISEEDLPQRYIIVPGIPFDVTQSWAY